MRSFIAVAVLTLANTSTAEVFRAENPLDFRDKQYHFNSNNVGSYNSLSKDQHPNQHYTVRDARGVQHNFNPNSQFAGESERRDENRNREMSENRNMRRRNSGDNKNVRMGEHKTLPTEERRFLEVPDFSKDQIQMFKPVISFVVRQMYTRDGYLNELGRSTLEVSGLAGRAGGIPALESAFSGRSAAVDVNNGQLTPSVQDGLRSIQVSANTPEDLVGDILAGGLLNDAAMSKLMPLITNSLLDPSVSSVLPPAASDLERVFVETMNAKSFEGLNDVPDMTNRLNPLFQILVKTFVSDSGFLNTAGQTMMAETGLSKLTQGNVELAKAMKGETPLVKPVSGMLDDPVRNGLAAKGIHANYLEDLVAQALTGDLIPNLPSIEDVLAGKTKPSKRLLGMVEYKLGEYGRNGKYGDVNFKIHHKYESPSPMRKLNGLKLNPEDLAAMDPLVRKGEKYLVDSKGYLNDVGQDLLNSVPLFKSWADKVPALADAMGGKNAIVDSKYMFAPNIVEGFKTAGSQIDDPVQLFNEVLSEGADDSVLKKLEPLIAAVMMESLSLPPPPAQGQNQKAFLDESNRMNPIYHSLVSTILTPEGYLTPLGRNIISMAGLRGMANNEPEMESAFDGRTPAVDSASGRLEPGVQAELAAEGISGDYPEDLIDAIVQRGGVPGGVNLGALIEMINGQSSTNNNNNNNNYYDRRLSKEEENDMLRKQASAVTGISEGTLTQLASAYADLKKQISEAAESVSKIQSEGVEVSNHENPLFRAIVRENTNAEGYATADAVKMFKKFDAKSMIDSKLIGEVLEGQRKMIEPISGQFTPEVKAEIDRLLPHNKFGSVVYPEDVMSEIVQKKLGHSLKFPTADSLLSGPDIVIAELKKSRAERKLGMFSNFYGPFHLKEHKKDTDSAVLGNLDNQYVDLLNGFWNEEVRKYNKKIDQDLDYDVANLFSSWELINKLSSMDLQQPKPSVHAPVPQPNAPVVPISQPEIVSGVPIRGLTEAAARKLPIGNLGSGFYDHFHLKMPNEIFGNLYGQAALENPLLNSVNSFWDQEVKRYNQKIDQDIDYHLSKLRDAEELITGFNANGYGGLPPMIASPAYPPLSQSSPSEILNGVRVPQVSRQLENDRMGYLDVLNQQVLEEVGCLNSGSDPMSCVLKMNSDLMADQARATDDMYRDIANLVERQPQGSWGQNYQPSIQSAEPRKLQAVNSDFIQNFNRQIHDTMKGLNLATDGLNGPFGSSNNILKGIPVPSSSAGSDMIQNLNKQNARVIQEIQKNAADSLNRLNNPLNGLNNPLAGLNNPLAGLNNPLAGLNNPLAGLSNPLAGLSNPLAGLNNPLAGLNNPLAGLNNPLAGLNNPLTGVNGALNPLNPLSPFNPIRMSPAANFFSLPLERGALATRLGLAATGLRRLAEETAAIEGQTTNSVISPEALSKFEDAVRKARDEILSKNNGQSSSTNSNAESSAVNVTTGHSSVTAKPQVAVQEVKTIAPVSQGSSAAKPVPEADAKLSEIKKLRSRLAQLESNAGEENSAGAKTSVEKTSGVSIGTLANSPNSAAKTQQGASPVNMAYQNGPIHGSDVEQVIRSMPQPFQDVMRSAGNNVKPSGTDPRVTSTGSSNINYPNGGSSAGQVATQDYNGPLASLLRNNRDVLEQILATERESMRNFIMQAQKDNANSRFNNNNNNQPSESYLRYPSSGFGGLVRAPVGMMEQNANNFIDFMTNPFQAAMAARQPNFLVGGLPFQDVVGSRVMPRSLDDNGASQRVEVKESQTLEFKPADKSGANVYEAIFDDIPIRLNRPDISVTPPLMVCWATTDSAKHGWPVFAVENAKLEFVEAGHPSSVVGMIDLINLKSTNAFEVFRPHWNQTQVKARENNECCVWVPVCSVMEIVFNSKSENELKVRVRFEGSKFDDEVKEIPKLNIVIRGVGLRGEWSSSDLNETEITKANIHETIKSSPVFSFEIPEKPFDALRGSNPDSRSIFGLSLSAEAKSSGLEFKFTEDDYSWIPEYLKPFYDILLKELKKVSDDIETDGVSIVSDDDLIEDEGDYFGGMKNRKEVFNPSKDLPVVVEEWGFSPRIVLRLRDFKNVSQPVRERCVPVGSGGMALAAIKSDNSEAMTGFRPTMMLEASPIQASFTSDEGFSTMSLRPTLIGQYVNVSWDVDVELSPLRISEAFINSFPF